MPRLPLLLLTSSGILDGSMKAAWETVLLQAQNATGSRKIMYVPDAALLPSKWPDRTSGGMAQKWIDRLGLEQEEVETLELATLPDGGAADALATAAAVYVESGNTYYLTYHTRRTGLDAAVGALVLRGGLYAGASAGAILAGATLRTCEWKAWDDPGAGQAWDLLASGGGGGGKGYGLQGLGLIQGGASLFPHHAPKWEARVSEMRPAHPEPVVVLDEYHFWLQGDRTGHGHDGVAAEAGAAALAKGAAPALGQSEAATRGGRLVPSDVKAPKAPAGDADANKTTGRKSKDSKGVGITNQVEVDGGCCRRGSGTPLSRL